MAKINKKSRDYCGMTDEERRLLGNLSDEEAEEYGGVFGGMRKQTMAERLMVASERLVGKGPDNNAFIVIGNDRHGSPHTGYGGKGHTQCDTIDIVAGLGGHCPVKFEDVNDEPIRAETNPNFYIDAARIYISQKTDIDKNFGIGDEFGKTKKKSNVGAGAPDEQDIGKHGAKSAVAIKADNIRIIGRESIRLVTGTDKFNSQGGQIGGKHGIEIVAMNETSKLQPMVLGDNLQFALTKMVDAIEATMEIFEAQMHYQSEFNQAIAQHTHLSPFFAMPTLPSEGAMVGGVKNDLKTMINTELSCMSHVSNMKGLILNYLTDSGANYILSPHNKTN